MYLNGFNISLLISRIFLQSSPASVVKPSSATSSTTSSSWVDLFVKLVLGLPISCISGSTCVFLNYGDDPHFLIAASFLGTFTVKEAWIFEFDCYGFGSNHEWSDFIFWWLYWRLSWCLARVCSIEALKLLCLFLRFLSSLTLESAETLV